jgi:hypothetical protein
MVSIARAVMDGRAPAAEVTCLVYDNLYTNCRLDCQAVTDRLEPAGAVIHFVHGNQYAKVIFCSKQPNGIQRKLSVIFPQKTSYCMFVMNEH